MDFYSVYDDIKKKYKDSKYKLKTIILSDRYIYCNIDDISFEIIDYNNISCYSNTTEYNDKIKKIIEENNEKYDINNLPLIVINLMLEYINDSAGFEYVHKDTLIKLKTEKIDLIDFYHKINSIIIKEREIQIDSFGKSHHDFLNFCKTYDNTFGVTHIGIQCPRNFKPSEYRGTHIIIQDYVQNSPCYKSLIINIIEDIEKNNYTKIGIYCTAGHHRSVAVVELIKKYIYKNAIITHLHLK
jgi:hypothetical protein